MDLFAASFQANENGDDLSQAAREVGEQELANRSWPKDAENEPCVVREESSHEESRVFSVATHFIEKLFLDAFSCFLIGTKSHRLVEKQNTQFPVFAHCIVRLIAVFAKELAAERIWNLSKRLLLWSKEHHLLK